MNKNSVKKNYIYNLIYQILVILIPLITTPYLSRVLGSEGIGIYSYTISIVTYFVLFGSLGISMYGQREIAYTREDVTKRTNVFWELNIIKTITMIISIVTFIFTFGNGQQYSVYYKILVLELIANIFDISWFFQGLEEFKKTVTRNTIVKVLSVICIFLFIKKPDDLWLYILIYTLSNLFGNISLWLYLPKYLNKVNIKKLKLRRHIVPILSLFVPQIAMQVYLVLDKTMLGSMLNNMSQVGNYEQSQKIIKTALTLVTALGTVVAPRIANIISSGNREEVSKYLEKSFRFVWLLGFPMMMGLIAVSDTVVPWFLGEGYEESKGLIKIGSMLIMAIGLNNVSGIQYLIPAKKQNIYTKSVIIAAIVNLIMNLVLIPKFKAGGALFASVMAEFLIMIVQLIDIRKDVNISIVVKNSGKYIISSFIMFIIVYFIGKNMNTTIYTTAIQVVIAGIIYAIMLVVLKDSFVIGIIQDLKKKIQRKDI